ncbi:zinc-ribbon domain-containing protein [Lactobacillus sp. PV037]|uniref:zinc-ribbon domain-containing protein n=1 Tax=unclassified Lactobacillus TaxID=2620435 RepID=UPI00223F6268|nr:MULTISPECIES: zinc-ribbon domain-containing protein [unclassified Lactobacillus]QNQ82194.1 zinc-ribbon domain-containing protein [Lactobacillus sp. PV012]QNQ83698.1 zinc-ribbon domain-containing protein [Lactobacillus sp. PV037]
MQSNVEKNGNNNFSVSLLMPWIKGVMEVNENFMHVKMPNTTFFGLIPAGGRNQNIPLPGLTSVEIESVYKIGSMLLGILIAIAGFAMFNTSALGAVLVILIGALIFLSGIRTKLIFEKSGMEQSVAVPFFESAHVREFADEVNNKIQEYQNDRNTRAQMDRQIQNQQATSQDIVNAINNQQQQEQAPQLKAVNASTDVSSDTDTKFCSSCGNQVAASASFCTNCGTKLN